jgi:hypothetical protein
VDLADVSPRDVFEGTRAGRWTVVLVGLRCRGMVGCWELGGGEELVPRELTMERGGEILFGLGGSMPHGPHRQ